MDEISIEFYEHTPKDSVGYMEPHLDSLRKRGVTINSLLDIGAAHGHFSDYFLTIFPDTKVTAIECNEYDAHYLDRKDYEVQFACLGATSCKRTFHLSKDDPIGGGSSFYLEDTSAFHESIGVEKNIVTLDSLNLGTFDFIKLDTQGSELDIIRGGNETIKKARFLLIECSFVPYNKGGCLIDDVLTETRKLGFRMLDTFGPSLGGHWYNYQKVQVDVLCVKDGDELLTMVK